jgi:hypothetical protein
MPRLNVPHIVEINDLAAQRKIQSRSRYRDFNVIRACSLVCSESRQTAPEGAVQRGGFHVNVPQPKR